MLSLRHDRFGHVSLIYFIYKYNLVKNILTYISSKDKKESINYFYDFNRINHLVCHTHTHTNYNN